MSIKQRGFTVGDLLLLIIILISTFLIVKKFNANKQSSFNVINSEINYIHINNSVIQKMQVLLEYDYKFYKLYLINCLT